MPGLEHVVSQSPAVGSPGLTVRIPPAALTGDVLGAGSTTPIERAVGTASPAVADGPLADGVGRAVVGLPSAPSFPVRSFEGEAADGSSSDIVRVGVDLHLVYEGERLDDEDVAALVQGTLIARLPEQVAGLELARAESTAAELRGGSYIERRAADAVS